MSRPALLSTTTDDDMGGLPAPAEPIGELARVCFHVGDELGERVAWK